MALAPLTRSLTTFDAHFPHFVPICWTLGCEMLVLKACRELPQGFSTIQWASLMTAPVVNLLDITAAKYELSFAEWLRLLAGLALQVL